MNKSILITIVLSVLAALLLLLFSNIVNSKTVSNIKGERVDSELAKIKRKKKIIKTRKSYRSVRAERRTLKTILKKYKIKNLDFGKTIYIRVFKKEKELEIWVLDRKKFKLLDTYNICTYSGGLGTKEREGDGKTPEGFYGFTASGLNPTSSYHLSFNIGYPNTYDKCRGYTGSYIMVHGNCVSIGCIAMGNQSIEEIYTIVNKTIEYGQRFVRIHIFPFRMTQENMRIYANNQHIEFWKNLKQGYDFFEKLRRIPNVLVKNKRYTFE